MFVLAPSEQVPTLSLPSQAMGPDRRAKALLFVHESPLGFL